MRGPRTLGLGLGHPKRSAESVVRGEGAARARMPARALPCERHVARAPSRGIPHTSRGAPQSPRRVARARPHRPLDRLQLRDTSSHPSPKSQPPSPKSQASSPLRQRLIQLLAASRQARHHGADRDVEHVGNFLVRQLVHVAQPDHFAKCVGEPVERRLQIGVQ